jgi:hypothetical protein
MPALPLGGAPPSYNSIGSGVPVGAPRTAPAPMQVDPAVANSTASYQSPALPQSSFQANFANLFGGGAPGVSNPAPAGQTSPAPTANTIDPSAWGNNPFVSNPTGTNNYAAGSSPLAGQTTNYNPAYFATPQTAQQIAGAAGGTVTQGNDLTPSAGSPFTLNQLENMVTLPNGNTVNAGILANIYSNGYGSNITDNVLSNALNFGNGSGPNGAGKGSFSVKNGQITYDANGTPAMLGQAAPQSAANPNGTPASVLNPVQQPQQQAQQQPQQQQFPQLNLNNPLFSSAIQQLYGANPFAAALGLTSGTGTANNGALGNLLNLLAGGGQSNGNNGSNISNISSLLNAIFAMQGNPSNNVLSPLFWGNQGGMGGGQAPMAGFYPLFQ